MKYENRIIAFIDIIGFKEIVKHSETDSSKLELIYQVLNFMKGQKQASNYDLRLIEIEEDAQKRELKSFDISNKVVCTVFSDSMVISVKIDNNKYNEIVSTIVANIAHIGANLVMHGILIRGAITYGNLIHDDNGLLIGQALINAHILESKSAIYPRIILSDKLLNKLNYPLKSKSDRYPYHQYIERFCDGCVGFHQMIYFQVIQPNGEREIQHVQRLLERIRQVIIKGLDSTFERADIYSKYEWLKEQYSKLIIFPENTKKKIYKLNESITGNNIHFSYTDDFYNRKDK